MRAGFIGWRGMVGSVLMDRMTAEGDFDGLDTGFFSTSSPGAEGPHGAPLLDAHDLNALTQFDVLLSCQGGEYTKAVHPQLRASGWNGIWIDAASALRMSPDAMLVLDPVNGDAIRSAIADGCTDFVGANCTVSLLLMAFNGLIQSGHVEWISTTCGRCVSPGAFWCGARGQCDSMDRSAGRGWADPGRMEVDGRSQQASCPHRTANSH